MGRRHPSRELELHEFLERKERKSLADDRDLRRIGKAHRLLGPVARIVTGDQDVDVDVVNGVASALAPGELLDVPAAQEGALEAVQALPARPPAADRRGALGTANPLTATCGWSEY
jgi:hypothetical protein